MINITVFALYLFKFASIAVSSIDASSPGEFPERMLCNGYISYIENSGQLVGSTISNSTWRYIYVTVDLKAQTMTKPWGGTRDGLSVRGVQEFTILRDSLDVLVLMGRHAEIIRIDRSKQPNLLQAMDTDGAITLGVCKTIP